MPNKKKTPKRKPTPKPEPAIQEKTEEKNSLRALWVELWSEKQNRMLIIGISVATAILLIIGLALVFSPQKALPAPEASDGSVKVDTNGDGLPDTNLSEDKTPAGGISQ